MGNLFKDEGNLEDAKRCFKSSLAIEAGLCEAHFNLGVIYKTQGKLDQAINSYSQAVEVNPMLHEGWQSSNSFAAFVAFTWLALSCYPAANYPSQDLAC